MPRQIHPEEEVFEVHDPLEVFNIGPLYPFDYCWLSGMKQGLILEVQMELIHRNRNLVVVDRSPLGVDPNASLSRCYLAFGNPYDKVTVFNFFENDICRGVPLDYFSRLNVTRRIDQIYKENGWISGTYLTMAAEAWRTQYHRGIAALTVKILETHDKLDLVDLLDKYALWLIPLLHFNNNRALRIQYLYEDNKELTSFWRDILSDFMILSAVNRTTFCVLASIEEIYFKDTYLGKKEMIENNTELYVFKPFLKKISIGVFVIALIAWSIVVGSSGSSTSVTAVVLCGLITLVPFSIFTANFLFWMFYTSGINSLQRLVPQKWIIPIKKIPGYLK